MTPPEALVVSTGFSVVRPRCADPSFLGYALTAAASRATLDQATVGVTLKAYRPKDLACMPIMLPNAQVQKRVATFLDQQVSRVQALIEYRRKLNDLLTEMREALVVKAVTGNADRHILSSNPFDLWMSGAPQHWRRCRLKHCLREREEIVAEDRFEDLLSVFAGVGVRPRSLMPDVGNKATTTVGYKKVSPGDLVVNKMLAWMGALGVSDFAGVTSPDYSVYSVNADVNSEYLHMLLRTRLYQAEIARRSRGIMPMRWRIYPNAFLDLPVVLPSLEEQFGIIEQVRADTEDLDALAELSRQSIELLREYRTAVISAAVTGQIEIPVTDAGEDVE